MTLVYSVHGDEKRLEARAWGVDDACRLTEEEYLDWFADDEEVCILIERVVDNA